MRRILLMVIAIAAFGLCDSVLAGVIYQADFNNLPLENGSTIGDGLQNSQTATTSASPWNLIAGGGPAQNGTTTGTVTIDNDIDNDADGLEFTTFSSATTGQRTFTFGNLTPPSGLVIEDVLLTGVSFKNLAAGVESFVISDGTTTETILGTASGNAISTLTFNASSFTVTYSGTGDAHIATFSFRATAVPEPGSLVILGALCAGVTLNRRRRKQSRT